MITVIDNYNIRHCNTFRMDVKCACWIDYTSPKDLPEVMATVGEMNFRCIGGGSNLLFLNDYDGALLHSSICEIESRFTDDGYFYHIGAGVNFDSFIESVCKAGIWGLENLSLIPGDAGSCAVQNIGAYGVEIKDFVESVECFDVENHSFVTIPASDCQYGYRHSIFKLPENRFRYIVTHLNLFIPRGLQPKVSYGNIAKLLEGRKLSPMVVRNEIISVRNEKLPDPEKIGSAGSFFKNPVVSVSEYDNIRGVALSQFNTTEVPHYVVGDKIKVPAAWMIEKCGWKGRTLGGAAVWHKQPLILVNAFGHASPLDVYTLEKEIIESVKCTFGITLEPEVDHIY